MGAGIFSRGYTPPEPIWITKGRPDPEKYQGSQTFPSRTNQMSQNNIIVHIHPEPAVTLQIAGAKVLQGNVCALLSIPIADARELWNELGNKLNEYENSNGAFAPGD